MLLCWERPAEDLLMSWVDHDTSADAILVAYFGTMSPAARRKLAARTTNTSAPVIVLDDAALAYLAAHGDRQLDAAMSILLPFSAVQPYVRKKRSLVAPEMFYGRGKELREVCRPERHSDHLRWPQPGQVGPAPGCENRFRAGTGAGSHPH